METHYEVVKDRERTYIRRASFPGSNMDNVYCTLAEAKTEALGYLNYHIEKLLGKRAVIHGLNNTDAII